MVSTRRSAGAGTQSNTEQDAEAGHQTEVVSKLRSSRVSVAGSSGHAPALQPIEEEQLAAAAAAPAAARHTRSHAEDASDGAAQQEQLQQQQHAAGQRQQQQRRQQRPLPSPAPAGGRAAGGSAAATAAAGAGCESGDDDDWDFDGPDMLQSLAVTIRSALGSKPSQQQHAHRTAGDGAAGDDDDDDVEQLRWRPHTGLQLPHKAAQVVATAAATTAAAASKQQPELGGGPVVHNPVLQEQDQDEDANAAAAAVSKPKGLAKHSRAPTQDAAAAAKAASKAAPETAGKNWYDLPAVKIDDNVKRDLRLLRLRGAYDPKRFYKSFDETKFPKHFAIGTVVDDPLDYYGGRLTTGQRKASLTEQLLADGELQATRKKRFNKLQEEAQKWVKHKKRKTSQPRKTPSKHRPKH